MAEKLDPEEWRQVVSKMHTALGDAITAHHGTIAQYLGDGLLAFFGAREASEHDPENAIRAALEGQATVSELLADQNVQLRGGIHTGLVVVGDLGAEEHKEFTASGDAVNLAARLQSAAPPGGILISYDTYRYVRGVFNLTPRPPLSVKGKSEPLQTYLVRSVKPRPFRSVTRGVAGIEARTVGREAEIEALRAAYLRAYEGHRMVWAQLVSDPGVGKSRLLEDMQDWLDLREETNLLLRARAFPDDSHQPFALVRRMWFDRFQIAEDAPLVLAEAKWVARFKAFYRQEDCEEQAQALGLLVGLSFEGSPHIKGMRDNPDQVKGRALVVSRELIQAIRQGDPLVILLEDLQWVDAASWEYLAEVLLDERTGKQPNSLFILGAARPDWNPPARLLEFLKSSPIEKGLNEGSIQIQLEPLTDQAIRELAQELLQRVDAIPDEIIDLLVERSEGVPYFTEEMVNWFIDNDILNTKSEHWQFFPEKLRAQPMPSTLQHMLFTRLSSLSQAERAALQRGAIFGRRFWTGGVEALGVSVGDELLSHLQPRGFVELQPESSLTGDTEWRFLQSMLQEVTYESVLKRERLALHHVAADWLEKQARQAGRLDEFAGLLGDHYEKAGELSTAADWYLRAGKRAMIQGAPREAVNFYTQALALLPPIDRERRWQVLLGREDGFRELGEGENQKADLETLLVLAATFNDDEYLAEGFLRQAVFGLISGNLNLFDQSSRDALAAAQRCGNESIEVKALAIAAIADLRRDDQPGAIQKIETALQIARNLGDKNALAFVLGRAAFLYSELGEIGKWHPLWVEQIELDHKLGNRMQEATGLGNLGSGYISSGFYKIGRGYIEQAVQICTSLGARRPLAYNLMNLGENHLATGDLLSAFKMGKQALQEISSTGDERGKVYTMINLGYVLLAMDDPNAASRYFMEGYETAKKHAMPQLACETGIGLAACATMQGQVDEASKFNRESWDYLKNHGWTGMGNPGRVYRTCMDTFDALGDEENFQEVLEIGYKEVMRVAEKENMLGRKQSFLENVPDHRAIVEMWVRRKPPDGL
jgi:class 3 adenylate cyclase/tetratricopeptide (TPR) repeat protein